jgi:hypothetical protein
MSVMIFRGRRIRPAMVAIACSVAVLVFLLSAAQFAPAKTGARAVPQDKDQIPLAGGGPNGKGLNDTWYLAEGSTAWGFNTHIQIENPNGSDLTGRMTFMLDDGSARAFDVNLAQASLTWVNPSDYIGSHDFSTKVQCLSGQQIAVSRVMVHGTGMNTCIHSSIGAQAPDDYWYLPEGSTGGEFETFICVQNPNPVAVDVFINYQTPEGGYVGELESLPAHSRKTYNVADRYPGEWSIGALVYSKGGVIAERSMYWGPGGSRSGGHESVGVTSSSTSWYLAEGSTGGDFETWVLVMNPDPDYSAIISLDFFTDTGPVSGPTTTLGPWERKTFDISQFIPNRWSVSTRVTSDKPVVAERAMYGNNRAWGHDSVGVTAPHSRILLPFSQCGPDMATPGYSWESWTLVQNPEPVPVKVRIWYLTISGAGSNYYHDDTLQPGVRKSFNMADAMPAGSWATGVVVECLTSGRKINAENCTYASTGGQRVAGCDSIGGFSD